MSYGAFGNFATDGTGFTKLFLNYNIFSYIEIDFWTPFHRDLALLRELLIVVKKVSIGTWWGIVV